MYKAPFSPQNAFHVILTMNSYSSRKQNLPIGGSLFAVKVGLRVQIYRVCFIAELLALERAAN
jgi:hypothetical protein